MPQMSPILWPELLKFFTISLLILMTMTYTVSSNTMTEKPNLVKTNKFYWKW